VPTFLLISLGLSFCGGGLKFACPIGIEGRR